MRLDQVNLRQARIWVKRSKNSLDTEQAIEPCNSISLARTSKSLRLLGYQPQYNEEMAAS